MDRTNVLAVSGDTAIGAIVRTKKGFIAFFRAKQNPALIDVCTAHTISELPDATYRNIESTTIEEAATAYAENRKPRWA